MESSKKKSKKYLCGEATAAKLSPEEKHNKAVNAAAARWDNSIPKAIKAGQLKIGDIIIPCAVLQDGTRLLTQMGILKALGRNNRLNTTNQGPIVREDAIKEGVVDSSPRFLSASNLIPFISNDLRKSWTAIKFRLPKDGGYNGKIAIGYDAKILSYLCDVYLDAKEAGVLTKVQIPISERCRLLQKGFAITGLVALIDECTGYQQARDRDALQQILETYLTKELAAWVKRFPDSFYKELYRLKGWEWKGMGTNRFPIVGRLTLDLVYERLFPGVLEEMKNRCDKDDNGYRKSKLHQWLSSDIGVPQLREHIHAVVTLQKSCDDWDRFYDLMEKIFPKKTSILQLDMFNPKEKEASK